MSTIPIVELIAVCDRMTAANHTLFERLGGWVADEPDPVLQRWFAVASHRHAWHAQLWSDRRPTVPIAAPAASPTDPSTAGRAEWYGEQLATLRVDLLEIEASVDPALDPSTARVIQLVTADLTDLASP